MSTTESKETKESLSQAYERLKGSYGKLLYKVDTPLDKDETEFVTIIVKSPENDRNVCGQFEKFIDQNPDKAREVLVQNCVVYKKQEVIDCNIAFRAVSTFIIELIPTAKVRIKN